MASASNLSERLVDIHLGTSESSPNAPSPSSPYYSEHPAPDTKQTNSDAPYSTSKGSESIRATLSDTDTLPSAPALERLSPAYPLPGNVNMEDFHPESPPPSYDSICVTQPKSRSTEIIPTISANVPPPNNAWTHGGVAATFSANVPPPNNGWRHGGVAQPISGPNQPKNNENDDCCGNLLVMCYACYCALECCRCCLECASLLSAFSQ